MPTLNFPSSIGDLISRFDSFVETSLPQVARLERTLFDDYAGRESSSVVIYGGGDIGRRLLAGFARLGVTPLAIVDRRLAETRGTIDGIPCLSVQEGCKAFGKKAVFIVAIFNQSGDRSFAAIRKELRRHGAVKVVYFMPVFWKYPEIFLPYYCFDSPSNLARHQAELLRVFRNLSDYDSRASFAFHLYQLIAPSPDTTLEAVQQDDTYFPPGLLNLSSGEAFLDGGAFDGVTLRRFVSRCSEFKSYLGIEPDPVSFGKLQEYVEEIRSTVSGHVAIRPCAIGRDRGEIRFTAAGTISSAVNVSGDISVPIVPLFELARGLEPTLIKLDIEGYELAALEGSVAFLQRSRPKLLVCLYHRQNHFFKIPLFVLENLPAYRLYVRRHKEHLDDFVLYALPSSLSKA